MPKIPGETPPTHDILPIPDGLHETTLEWAMSVLSAVAADYELPAFFADFTIEQPEQIDEYIAVLERHIQAGRESALEKAGALKVLKQIHDVYIMALEQTREV